MCGPWHLLLLLMIILLFYVSDQRDQDLQIQCADLPPSEPVRAVPEDRQRLLPLPASPSGVWRVCVCVGETSSAQ